MSKDEEGTAPEDLDPAAPGHGEEGPQSDLVDATNRGLDGRGDTPEEDEGLERLQSGVMDIDIAKARQFLQACVTSNPRVKYGLGAKIKPGQVPGRDFKSVDCSGFVREVIRRSTDLANRFPDGSVVQHDWVKARGFKKAERSSAAGRDGAVRIAFLSPRDAPSGIGHVALIHDGNTLESHGGVGPNSRPWNGRGWQSKSQVYVLMPGD